MTLIILVSVLTGHASAADFGNPVLGEHTWASTVRGKFECIAGKKTDYNQVLKINDNVIYDERHGYDKDAGAVDVYGGEPLSTGIPMGSKIEGGCPRIIANEKRYVIFERQLSPPGSGGGPSAGIFGIGVINFNATSPILIELAELQQTNGNLKRKFTWDNNGFTMAYFGYPYDASGGSKDSPKPKSHTIRFSFSSGDISQVR